MTPWVYLYFMIGAILIMSILTFGLDEGRKLSPMQVVVVTFLWPVVVIMSLAAFLWSEK